MKLIVLNEEEFNLFASKHPQASFYQTTDWGHLKKTNGWDMHLVGFKDDNNSIVAATMLLFKTTPIKMNMIYSPRGFLIDFDNLELLKEFTKEIVNYAKKNKGIFIKLDPYIMYKERDIDGNIVNDGVNNEKAFKNLINCKYKHFGFNLMQDALQPRFIFVTKTKNRTIDEVMSEMDSKTRQIIRKNERLCIKTREIGYDELDKFKDIMQHTGDRRDFIDRPLKYYQNMYSNLSKSGIIKILLAELDTVSLIESLNKEIDELKKDYDDRKYKYDNGINKMNIDKFNLKQKEVTTNIERVNKKLDEVLTLQKENGEIITLGGILFLIHGGEVLSLVGGSYKKFMEYQSAYTIHWAGVKMAIEGNYDRYNFYGITGDFNPSNPLLGLYLFKKSFGGVVVELIGEFDLIVNKPLYIGYKIAFGLYHFLKNGYSRLIKVVKIVFSKQK
ncbi:MAG: peptidoglycan bridge formation glycyltransferase FemA/FemB family protein [Bacilli bacterium]|nr:peptidoglycan bridge formation glycyltransferase FemA/FemB family protein [Bacilli bacterium]